MGALFLIRVGVVEMQERKKVLHIGNTAGVPGYLSYFMTNYFDINCLVLMRSRYDPYNFANEFVKKFNCKAKEFYLRCWFYGLFYDIIHIHGSDEILKMFKSSFLHRNKKLVIHYHGTDIRGLWENKKNRWIYADKILVSTPDLLKDSPTGTEYLPTVINEKLCAFFKSNRKFNNSAFHTYQEATDKALEYAGKYRLRLHIQNRSLDPLSHEVFLKRLSRYEYYIDVKKRNKKILEAMSLTGLEALYMGVKLVRWDGERRYKFPNKHLLINVCEKLYNIYKDLMN